MRGYEESMKESRMSVDNEARWSRLQNETADGVSCYEGPPIKLDLTVSFSAINMVVPQTDSSSSSDPNLS